MSERYMLISTSDARQVIDLLMQVARAASASPPARQAALDAMQRLHHGLHNTDAVPADFQREWRR